jgi:hypothetical protein
MRLRLAVVAVLAVASLGLFAAGSSARTEGKCTFNKVAGHYVKNHVGFTVFCGSARLTLNVGGKISHYGNGTAGMCIPTAGSLQIGMGTLTQLGHTPQYNSLLMSMGAPKDGTYHIAVLNILKKGDPNWLAAAHITVVLTKKRTHGTFNGAFQGGKHFSGTFTCPATK